MIYEKQKCKILRAETSLSDGRQGEKTIICYSNLLLSVAMTCFKLFGFITEENQLTYLLQIDWFSLLKLQGQERISGQRGRTAPILEDPLTCQLAHPQSELQSKLTLEVEGPVLTLALQVSVTLP